MTALTDSIYRALATWGPNLAPGHWGVPGYTLGLEPAVHRPIRRAVAEIQAGQVVDIRVYSWGEVPADDTGCVDITAEVEDYQMDRDYHGLVDAIAAAIHRRS